MTGGIASWSVQIGQQRARNDAECADTKAADERAANEVPIWDTLRPGGYSLVLASLTPRMANDECACECAVLKIRKILECLISPFTTDKSFYVARYCTVVEAT